METWKSSQLPQLEHKIGGTQIKAMASSGAGFARRNLQSPSTMNQSYVRINDLAHHSDAEACQHHHLEIRNELPCQENSPLSPSRLAFKRSPLSKAVHCAIKQRRASVCAKWRLGVDSSTSAPSAAPQIAENDVAASSIFLPIVVHKPEVASSSLVVEQFSSSLSLKKDLIPIFSISEISEAPSGRFAFEGKVLVKYGTFKISVGSYLKFLKVDLSDRKAEHSITLVVAAEQVKQFVHTLNVGGYARIEGVNAKPRNRNDGGSYSLSLYATATTLVVKSEPFECKLQFLPKHRICELFDPILASVDNITITFVVVKNDNVSKADGEVAAQLTIADGPSPLDRATLTFVPTRRSDFFRILDEIQEKGLFMCVARNIGIFKGRSQTLSIFAATVLTPVPTSCLEAMLKTAVNQQHELLGVGKKVFGVLQVVNINAINIDYLCMECKSSKVSRQEDKEAYCYSCAKPTTILKSPLLQGKITKRDGDVIIVSLHGAIVDKMGFSKSFLELYSANVFELKSMLLDVKIIGSFNIDISSCVTDFKREGPLVNVLLRGRES